MTRCDLSVTKKWLIMGDSNLSRFPRFSNKNLQIESYPGANFRHAKAILVKTICHTKVQKVVLAFGINSKDQKFKATSRKQTMAAAKTAATKFPAAEIWLPLVNYPSTLSEQTVRLHTVLGKLQEAGVTLNMGKCELSRREVKFLGHILAADGVQPDPDKVKAVMSMREPSNTGEVRSFLGMLNQLGKYIPGLAEKDKPLRDLLSKKYQWVWGCAQRKAFEQLKNDLTSPPVLTLYDPNKELKLSADASSYGLGAVLIQKEGDVWKPVAYASRSMTDTACLKR